MERASRSGGGGLRGTQSPPNHGVLLRPFPNATDGRWSCLKDRNRTVGFAFPVWINFRPKFFPFAIDQKTESTLFFDSSDSDWTQSERSSIIKKSRSCTPSGNRNVLRSGGYRTSIEKLKWRDAYISGPAIPFSPAVQPFGESSSFFDQHSPGFRTCSNQTVPNLFLRFFRTSARRIWRIARRNPLHVSRCFCPARHISCLRRYWSMQHADLLRKKVA